MRTERVHISFKAEASHTLRCLETIANYDSHEMSHCRANHYFLIYILIYVFEIRKYVGLYKSVLHLYNT